MSQIYIEQSAVIDAPPDKVYGIIADYHEGHHAILPEPYFTGMTVEEGGTGAGTVIRVDMNVMGAKRSFHMDVIEPEPGRVITETDRNTGQSTSFIIDPVDDGRQSHVTIALDSQASPGFTGFMEKLLNPPITRRIFKKELAILAEYVRSH